MVIKCRFLKEKFLSRMSLFKGIGLVIIFTPKLDKIK